MSRSIASLTVILNTKGQPLDLRALHDMPSASVVRAEIAEGETAACVTATVTHRCDRAEFRQRVGRWAGERGWLVTVAPLPGPR